MLQGKPFRRFFLVLFGVADWVRNIMRLQLFVHSIKQRLVFELFRRLLGAFGLNGFAFIVLRGCACFALSASDFSLLAQRISHQKKGHPNFRFYLALLGLSGGHRNSTWPRTKNRARLRDSDSRWPKTPAKPALLGAADGALNTM